MKARVLVRGLLLITSLVVIAYLLQQRHFGELLDKQWIDTEIRGHGVRGELFFIAVAALFTAVGLPRQVVAFLGGYAFGFLHGGALALAGAVGGCVLTFTYARFLGRALVMNRFSGRLRRLDDFISDNPLSMTVLIRLLPAGSNLAINLMAGVSNVCATPFFVGSALGYIPQMLVFALVGSGINVDPMLRIGIAVVLFVISGVLGVYLYRRFRHGRVLDEELERELGEESTGDAVADGNAK